MTSWQLLQHIHEGHAMIHDFIWLFFPAAFPMSAIDCVMELYCYCPLQYVVCLCLFHRMLARQLVLERLAV